jgi:guanine deaminase
LILTGQLLLTDQDKCWVEPGIVRVAEDRITEVIRGEIAASPDFGDSHSLIAPGFIDCHLHLPQFNSIGSHGRPLLQWLQSVILPDEGRWEDVTFAQSMTDHAIDQLLACGTTGIAAYTTLHQRSSLAAMQLAKSRGMRAWIGQSLMDSESHAPYCLETSRLLDETYQSLNLYPPGGRVAAAVTPRYALGCTEILLESCGELARETGSLIQTHLAENRDECRAVCERFGKDYLDVYDSFGLVTSKSIFGHGIHLTQENMIRLSDSKSVIAHCPTANEFLNSGTMRWSELTNRQVPIALGSDIGAGYEISMVRVARSMILSAARVGGQFPDASKAFFDITRGNAQALGWDDSGILREGAAADLLLIEPKCDWQNSSVDPLSRLLFSWNDHWIRSVWLRGQRLV